MSKKKVYWPSWRYGPNGEARIFDRPEDVPVDWFASKAEAEDYAAANVVPPPENGADYWEGYSKTFLIQMLRHAKQKVHANISPRKAYEKAVELGLIKFETKGEGNAAEKGLEQESDLVQHQDGDEGGETAKAGGGDSLE